jgi:hypothetical protein
MSRLAFPLANGWGLSPGQEMVSQPHEPNKSANDVGNATAKSGRSLRYAALFKIRGQSAVPGDPFLKVVADALAHDPMVLRIPPVVYQIFLRL